MIQNFTDSHKFRVLRILIGLMRITGHEKVHDQVTDSVR